MTQSSYKSFGLAIIKPDAVNRNLTNQIIAELLTKFNIFELKTTRLTLQQARMLYIEHENKEFYDDLCEYMCSGTVVLILVICPSECVKQLRESIASIRQKYAISIRENSIHGSSSEEAAERECKLFFNNN